MSDNRKQLASFDRYAIFQTGGKQYQALEGRTIGIEKLDAAEGSTVSFSDVLLRKTGPESVEIGKPFLATPITAVIVKHMRGPKLIAFKFKRRKKYKRKQGHRQPITVVRIEAI
ncbi:50S ribosomal protein L21 [Candidatus Dependentiae bacterium]|nr:50S ribosomal protein L21 [Candidatus Dependentiae bacterium]